MSGCYNAPSFQEAGVGLPASLSRKTCKSRRFTRRHHMTNHNTKYDFPDRKQPIDLQTGMAMRIWL